MQQPPPQPPMEPQYGLQPPQSQQTNGMAIAALVMGILGLLIFFGIGSLLALIFGYVARSQIKRSQGTQSGNGMAITGIVLGWVGIVVTLVMTALVVAGSVALFNFSQSPEFQEVIEEGKTIILEESLDEVTKNEAECTGIETYPDMGTKHVRPGASHVPYNSNPPTSGPHWAAPADPGFYEPSSQLAVEQVVHNMEHGQVVIWYRPYVNEFLEDQVEQLVAQDPDYLIGVPFEDMNEPFNIVITSWTKARACVNASQVVVDDFRRRFQGVAPEPLTPPFNG